MDYRKTRKDRKDRKDRKERKSGGAAAAAKKTRRRKLSKGAAEWNKKVMEVFHRMRKANSAVKFRDALIQAAKERKAGK